METTVKKRNSKANGRLTEKQIRRRVGEAWAVLGNPEFDEKDVLVTAELLYHNADKAKAREYFRQCKNGSYAFFFYGTPDPNIIYIL